MANYEENITFDSIFSNNLEEEIEFDMLFGSEIDGDIIDTVDSPKFFKENGEEIEYKDITGVDDEDEDYDLEDQVKEADVNIYPKEVNVNVNDGGNKDEAPKDDEDKELAEPTVPEKTECKEGGEELCPDCKKDPCECNKQAVAVKPTDSEEIDQEEPIADTDPDKIEEPIDKVETTDDMDKAMKNIEGPETTEEPQQLKDEPQQPTDEADDEDEGDSVGDPPIDEKCIKEEDEELETDNKIIPDEVETTDDMDKFMDECEGTCCTDIPTTKEEDKEDANLSLEPEDLSNGEAENMNIDECGDSDAFDDMMNSGLDSTPEEEEPGGEENDQDDEDIDAVLGESSIRLL